jgi:ATP-dependent DNA helicase RecQ
VSQDGQSLDLAMREARENLAHVFGFDSFRPLQEEVLEALFAGEDVLAVMPTASGKSLCFQLPALQRKGVTLVISPLIALMQDQIRQLKSRGIVAAALHSGNSFEENAAAEAGLINGDYKLFYLAPERLAQEEMRAVLQDIEIDLLAVDEAHCIAEWGHDFRPDYLALKETAQAIGVRQILALTASANARTRADIVDKLFMRQPRVFVGSFDRPNLTLSAARKLNDFHQIERLIARHKGESGIIYCASRRAVESLAARLASNGHWTLPYHARLSPETRAAHQEEFFSGQGIIMVATIAFGMGIDKANVRFVCHADLPDSIEAYHQEIGRAGRDGLPAETLALFGDTDIWMRERRISATARARRGVEARKLDDLLRFLEGGGCRRQMLLSAFDEKAKPCGNCDICNRPFAFVSRILDGPHHLKRRVKRTRQKVLDRLSDYIRVHEKGLGEDLQPEDQTQDQQSAPVDVERQSSSAEIALPLTVSQMRLLAQLKAKRLELARVNRIAPSAILADIALRNIVRMLPRTSDEFLLAIGAREEEATYCAAFLQIVAKHEE